MIRGHNLGLTLDQDTSAVTYEAIAQEVRNLGNSNREQADYVDAVIVGCSAFRACVPGFIDYLEEVAGGIPVVTSTQAILWDTLRLAGIKDTVDGYGTLFKLGADSHDINLVPEQARNE